MLKNMIFKSKCKPMKKGEMSWHEPKPNIVLDGISKWFCDNCMKWTERKDKCKECNNDKLIADHTY